MRHWGENCSCYDDGYSDGLEAASQDAVAKVETPLALAVMGPCDLERVPSWRIREWAETQADRHIRYWMLGVADAVEAIEEERRAAAERAAQEQQRAREATERFRAVQVAREAAAGECWPG
jgi:hypothetical protein